MEVTVYGVQMVHVQVTIKTGVSRNHGFRDKISMILKIVCKVNRRFDNIENDVDYNTAG